MKAILTAILAFLLAAPALAQSPSCRDDPAQPRCVAEAEKAQRALYDAPPAEDYARQKTEIVRAFFVDGYGHDAGLVTLSYAPAAEPRVEWRMPKPHGGEETGVTIDAILPLSVWRDVTDAGTYFDRALVQLPQAQGSICLHGWTTRVEMVGKDGKVRRATQSRCGDDALVWPLAQRITAAAIAAMPACALLDARKTRNDITRLNKCARLDGDRAAAAEATNVYDSPWFANPRGEDFARALTYLFAEQLNFAWPDEPVTTEGAAAARIWSRHAGEANFFARRTFGETADRVRMEGVVLMPGATVEAARKPLPATLIWERCNGFDFRLTHFWTGPNRPRPEARTSCSHEP
ncbi:hypothetical protein [Sphingomonas fuzhouensis]|uniref:hypothetical protein n=1 Tax=Sphingomonas fuzhouensis TaxID=3106033 RepID=UPI002AFE14B2|nr:hypothetical protein [Sphingomonas sp. SGZ-02]